MSSAAPLPAWNSSEPSLDITTTRPFPALAVVPLRRSRIMAGFPAPTPAERIQNMMVPVGALKDVAAGAATRAGCGPGELITPLRVLAALLRVEGCPTAPGV